MSKTTRHNLTLPRGLKGMAEEHGINVSRAATSAIITELQKQGLSLLEISEKVDLDIRGRF